MRTMFEAAEQTTTFDDLATRLSSRQRSLANDLLDIKLYSTRAVHPGSCVKCFFRILSRAESSVLPEVSELRRWLESQIEVVALGREASPLCRYPLDAGYGSLEECCKAYMDAVRDLDGQDDIELQFCYRQPAA